jgi:hypothetical protein
MERPGRPQAPRRARTAVWGKEAPSGAGASAWKPGRRLMEPTKQGGTAGTGRRGKGSFASRARKPRFSPQLLLKREAAGVLDPAKRSRRQKKRFGLAGESPKSGRN